MKNKIIFLVICLLILYVIIHLTHIRKNNVVALNKALNTQENNIYNLQKEKEVLEKKVRSYTKIELDEVPKALQEGFEDPEIKFAQFMNYIQASKLKEMNGSISISQLEKYKQDPVPLFESKFDIVFDMISTFHIESFFDYLFNQKNFPLQVKKLNINRVPGQYPKVSVKIALLIPPKIELQ